MMGGNNSSQSKKDDSSMVYFALRCIMWFFVALIVCGIISLFVPRSHSGKTDADIQEDAFWDLQREADEGAKKAQEYEEQERKIKQNY